MNDYERRVLDCAQFHLDVSDAARQSSQGYIAEYYSYTAKLAANPAQSQAVIPVQADSDFALIYISLAQFDAAANRFLSGGVIPFQITDTGQGKDLFSAPTIAALTSGGAGPSQNSYSGVPFMLPFPRIIPRNTNVKIDIPVPTTTDVYVSLTGARIATRVF